MSDRKTVFIGGSRSLFRLNQDVKRRLDRVIERGFTVFVGDANGADKAIQQHLASRHYEKVVVFCVAGNCRNNLGDWPLREIAVAPNARRDFAFFATKDRAMGSEANYGLMLWDGKSRGTLTNIEDLVGQAKPVVVYVAPEKSFVTVREHDDLTNLADRVRPAIRQQSIRRPHPRRSHSARDVFSF